MPYPNEHALRIKNPNDFDPDTYRRTHGSGKGKVQGVDWRSGEAGFTKGADGFQGRREAASLNRILSKQLEQTYPSASSNLHIRPAKLSEVLLFRADLNYAATRAGKTPDAPSYLPESANNLLLNMS